MSAPPQSPNFTQLYGHLPPAFQPHDFAQRGARTKWRENILPTLQNLSELPHGLELRKGYHYQPPRFDYGWKLSENDLSSLAQQHGFAVASRVPAGGLDVLWMTSLLNDVLATSSSFQGYVRIDQVVNPTSSVAVYSITLADSYRSGNQTPPSEQVDQIRKFLGLKAQLGWHLDGKWSNWQWTTSDEVAAEERQRKSFDDRRRR